MEPLTPRMRAVGAFLSLYYGLTWLLWQHRNGFNSLSPELGLYLPHWLFYPFGEWLLLPPLLTRLAMRLLLLLALWQCWAFVQKDDLKWPMRALKLQLAAKLFFYLHQLPEMANFHHVHLFLTLLFVGATPRELYLRWGLATVYWMAGIVKLTPSWLAGEYFNSLPTGLPLLPQHPAVITLACQALTFLELFGPFLWMHPRTNRAGWALFLGFHIYSGVIVGYWYTTLMIPFVAALKTDEVLRWPQQRGWLAVPAVALAASLWQVIIPGDVRQTAEGRYLGLFMFDANHKARVVLQVDKGADHYRFETVHDWPFFEVGDQPRFFHLSHNGRGLSPRSPVRQEGVVLFHPDAFDTLSPRVLSDPYLYWCWGWQLHKRFQPDRIAIRIDSLLDGNETPFTTVDVANLPPAYNPFWRNAWINAP